MSIDFDIVAQATPALLQGLKVTATVSMVGIPLGILAGTVAAYMADSASRPLRMLALGYVELVRNIPFLILVYLSFFGLPKLGLLVSAFGIAIGATAFYTGGYFCEILRAALRSVPRGQVRAALSLGMTGWQVQRHVVVPQIFGFLIPPSVSLTIMMFKDSAVFSVMSLPELTYQSNLMTADTFAYLEVLTTTALIYWGCSAVFDAFGHAMETRVRRWSHR
ncbi:amino acid ABC transporter permease [Aromatoleum evansii]|uniref:Amino acid ABC transporter permease n=2 Tax=Aromatoleum TaxID=551759 RepID=A0ABZ1AFB3_AROEV|nr:amino acid ABC transporter permease [Aromatoleum petrolei]NMF90087.1 ABC transporter permease subunit [Aromatoleum petrolei]QTQ34206.1 ABC transporter, permease protein, amino acid transport [Aromatoleum petrolei]WRL44553.1 amino acid ABC transporter permease [Aromatoleum evansii]